VHWDAEPEEGSGVEAEDGGGGSESARPWEEPDALETIPPAPKFQPSWLPPELADVAVDIAERQQVPLDFPAWSLLVSTAAMIGRRARIRLKQHDDWSEPANLWVADIAWSSQGKTPAEKDGQRVLRRRNRLDHQAHLKNVERWEAECAAEQSAAKEDGRKPDLPQRPVPQRCSTTDVTPEKLAELLEDGNQRLLTINPDEIASVFLGFDRYRGGKGAGEREFYLAAYSGRDFHVDRIGRPSQYVREVLVSIIGGIQPDKATAVLRGGPDDGLLARLTCIYPNEREVWELVDRWPRREAHEALYEMADRLVAADWSKLFSVDPYAEENDPPFCRLEAGAQALWNAWYTDLKRTPVREHGLYDSRWGKYEGLAGRLLLIQHCIEVVQERARYSAAVGEQVVARVLALMDEYIKPMDRRVYAQFANPPAAAGGRRIARWLIDEKIAKFTARDVYRHQWSELPKREDAEPAIEWLAAHRWVREVETSGRRLGRPSLQQFEVNPAVHVPGTVQ